ncbi:MAG: phosphoribosylaminoimidazolesuccinocarboxamide synthase [Candidatus Brocadiia bacterium]|jgi:phosphoribosylaminoimidazole-succinocarboxamide synthase|nr:phosphoribosylaminoimidazolesuccinocarboxamide synthase [Candidatus Brocadiia bacterium]
MDTPQVVMETNLEGLELFNRGKVRDVYRVGEDLLIVATDRLSAYDSVLPTGIPWKGKVLTALTLFWLDYLGEMAPNHLIAADPGEMGPEVEPHADLLRGRSMLVRRADVVPVECVVRGYLAGSGWREYRERGEVCGVRLPAGLRQAEQLPEPIFTPTTKAASGHDEPLTMDEAAEIVGRDVAEDIRDRSIAVYGKAAEYAAARGIIIADTKFEWGLHGGGLMLIDEVLTPDSSRFWPADSHRPGSSPFAFDKQYVRQWLDDSGWDHSPPAPSLPPEVVEMTAERYREACRRLTDSAPE